MKCDKCGVELTCDNIGLVTHPEFGEKIQRCRKCHPRQKKRPKTGSRRRKKNWRDV